MRRSYYIVICKGDRGEYVLATRRQFPTHTAAELYLASVAVSRAPIIVAVD